MQRNREQHFDDGGEVDSWQDSGADAASYPDESAVATAPMQEAPPTLPASFMNGFGAPTGPVTPGFNGSMPRMGPSPLAGGVAPAIAAAQPQQQQAPHGLAANHPKLAALLQVMSTLGDVGAGMAQPGGNLATGFGYARQAQDQRQQNASTLKLQTLKTQQEYAEKLAQQNEQRNKDALETQKAQRDAVEKGFRPVIKGPQTVNVPDQPNILNPSQAGYSTQTIPPPAFDPSRSVQIGNQTYEGPAPPPPPETFTLDPDLAKALHLNNPEQYQVQGLPALKDLTTLGLAVKKSQETDKPIPMDQQALEVAAALEAKKRGIQVDPSKPILAQLPIEVKAHAFSQAKTLMESSDTQATRESTRETASLNRSLIQAHIDDLRAKADQRRQDSAAAAANGPELSATGQKKMSELSSTVGLFDQALNALEPYRDVNQSGYFAPAMAKYHLGTKTPEYDVGNAVGTLDLSKIAGRMQYVQGSRNYQAFKDASVHLPDVWLDSPANSYDKLMKAKQQLLRMQAETGRYETKHAGVNAPPVPVPDQHQQFYLKLAGGDRGKAMDLAQKDGWAVPAVQPSPGNSKDPLGIRGSQ